jgi:hypothetical protein
VASGRFPRQFRAALLTTLAVLAVVLGNATASLAQLTSVETPDLDLVYLEPTQSFLAPHVGRSFENSLAFQRKIFDFAPSDKITVLLTDFADFGNAGAESVPHNLVTVKLAPLSFAFETFTANERMNYLMNHELVHIATADRAAGPDRLFRALFRGKVAPSVEHPESIGFFYLTNPRRAAPRWYLEGIAVFLDTWMAGGLGRAQGPYDEMVFRSMVRDGSAFYDPLGLSSELTKTDFRLEANSYLYGARFMDYLAYTYSPEALIRWVSRTKGSRAYYAAQFRQVYGISLERAWSDWVDFERTFQNANLAAIRQHPTTPYKDVSRQALGSLSRAFLDRESGKLYAGVNYPGTLGYIGAISLEDGSIENLHDIKQPRSYTVTSLAYDAADRTLFYTADNTAWRDVMALDLETKQDRMLLKDARIGELVFDKSDRSLWGVRVLNGICTLVRVPAPYREWQSVHSWPYGETAYDLDLSGDGRLLSASVGEINGRQTLRVMDTSRLLAGDPTPLAQFDFGSAIPENFVFSEDGRYLYGSSYYTGVSNIFRYELKTGKIEALTNAETGFFEPIERGDGSLIVFRYTGAGFVPAIIKAAPLEDVSAITLLGQQVVEKHPALTTWNVGSPASIPIESMITKKEPYRPLRRLRAESVYPIVAGYKDSVAYGINVALSDPVQLNGATFTAAYSPDAALPADERIHVRGAYRRFDWTATASLNEADFYDLFGPTKTSRRGYSLGVGHTSVLIFDEPRRMDLQLSGRVAGNLDQLPQYQNVFVTVDRLFSVAASLSYTDAHSSLGSVDDEKGQRWTAVAQLDDANSAAFAKVHATYDRGFPLPMGHSSLWVRNAVGASPQNRDEPFANFYFGAFGNNYVDRGAEKRYREYYAFPGAPINGISGRNFGKSTIEWNLPPLRFRRAGTPGFYVTWMRPALFGGGLVTNMDSSDVRRVAGDVGGQLDFRLTALSNLDLTLSAGAAVVVERHGASRRELMVSLKVLR